MYLHICLLFFKYYMYVDICIYVCIFLNDFWKFKWDYPRYSIILIIQNTLTFYVWYKCTEFRHEHKYARNQLNFIVCFVPPHTYYIRQGHMHTYTCIIVYNTYHILYIYSYIIFFINIKT